MNLKKISDNILFFEFENFKDITLTFFRVQEYYESKFDTLYRKKFTFFDFLEQIMTNRGEIDYFSYWGGFNVPGHIFTEWYDLYEYSELSHREASLYLEVINNIEIGQKFYVIGSLKKDKMTLKHELAHAFYYLDSEYAEKMDKITERMKKLFKNEYKQVIKYLKSSGYHEEVFNDEIQAYLSTESHQGLIDEEYINLDYCDDFKEILTSYRKTFKQQIQKMSIDI